MISKNTITPSSWVARSLLSLALLLQLCLFCSCATITPPPHVTPVERDLETTGYCKCKKCTGWRRTWYGKPVYSSGPNKGQYKAVGVTASGTKARKGTIAADITRYPFGTVMYVPGYGYGRVEDRGSAIQKDHIDLFFSKHKDAVKWGRQVKRVRIWFPGNAGRRGTPP